MIALLRELIKLLDASQKRRLWTLQLLIILMAFTEIMGVASIAPFMAVVVDSTLIEGNGFLAQVYGWSGIQSVNWFVFWLGVMVLIALAMSTIISVFTLWRLSLFAFEVGAELSNRLYQHYLHQSWLFHTATTSAQLTKQIATETIRVTNDVLVPLMQMNARLVLGGLMSGALILYNPIVALAGLIIFTVSYWIIYKLVKGRLYRNGQRLSQANTERFRLLNDGLGGIKDTLLLNRQESFIASFQKESAKEARSRSVNITLGVAPRYLMELVAFGSVIILVLFLIKANAQSLSLAIPILSVYALAGLKLLPAFQQIYASISSIKGSSPAIEALKEDLQNSRARPASFKGQKAEPIIPNRHIKISHASFCYPGQPHPALRNINATIKANQTIGIVGASGSGKSTLIDLLLGLITPDKGQILIDDKPIDDTNRRAWQNAIGFVSQSIFLTEGTIAENIAFGLPQDKINKNQIRAALELAHLSDFVVGLPDGADTQVGERGVKLSGGQRQRIGIARALYQNAQMLIFDEATSALDGITEKLVMDAVHDFGGKKTIILVAHRLKTVQQCDIIFVMDRGKIIDSGTFQSLQQSNPKFAKMAQYA